MVDKPIRDTRTFFRGSQRVWCFASTAAVPVLSVYWHSGLQGNGKGWYKMKRITLAAIAAVVALYGTVRVSAYCVENTWTTATILELSAWCAVTIAAVIFMLATADIDLKE